MMKRIVDIVISLTALIILSQIFIWVEYNVR
ncbi:sugar transferase, partial [Acinetobacter baumannii]